MKIVEQMNEPELPSRMFADGDEPVGIRVTAYHKSNGIQKVLNVLEADEIEFLRRSSFGKFIGLADRGSFSGRFCRFLISRQLKVSKKHECWFLFAGQPIRFSLREFAIVTGLPCGKYPEKARSKKKGKKSLRNLINEKSNWDNLFGKLNQISVDSVLGMLKNKTVTDKETRIKYACLALVDSVLLPTTHFHKIDRDHAECIRDLGDFFAYPWGRTAFDMVMSSIKDRDEVSLSQDTVAIKGFVYALQMVIMEAVPRLREEIKVPDCLENDSEDDLEDGDGTSDDEEIDENREQVAFSPGHARTVNGETNVMVRSIIQPADGGVIDESEMSWPDELDDVKVSNLLFLINQKRKFCRDMFTGGATKADVQRMIEEAKAKKREESKAKKRKVKEEREIREKSKIMKHEDHISEGLGILGSAFEFEKLADRVANKVKDDVTEKLDEAFTQIWDMKAMVRSIKNFMCKEVKHKMKEMEENIIASVRSIVTEATALHGIKKGEACYEMMEGDEVRRCRNEVDVNRYDSEELFCGSCVGGGVSTVDRVNRTKRHVNSEQVCVVDGTKARMNNFIAGPPNFSLGLSDDETEFEGSSYEVPGRRPTVMNVSEPCWKGDSEGGSINPVFNHVSKRRRTRSTKRGTGSLRDRLGQLHSEEDKRCVLHLGRLDYCSKFNNLKEKLRNSTFWLAVGETGIRSDEFLELIERRISLTPNVMDVLMSLTDIVYRKQGFPLVPPHVKFLDTAVVTLLSRSYCKFRKGNNRVPHIFENDVISCLKGDEGWSHVASKYYFPFNFDKKHWVGVCVDIGGHIVYVFDSDVTLRSGAAITHELQPIATMFPKLHRQIYGLDSKLEDDCFNVVRLSCVPQNNRNTDSGVTAVLQMQAHSIAGPEASAQITPNVIEQEIQRLSVILYELNGNVL